MGAVIAASLVSATLSGWLLLPDVGLESGGAGSTFGLYWGPGVYFGVAMAALLLAFDKVAPPRLLGWIGVSILAWRLAIETVMSSISLDASDSSDTFSGVLKTFIIPGAIGAAVLAVGHGLLVARMRGRWIAQLAIGGAVLGGMMYLSTKPDGDGGTARIILMFAIWQVGIGLMLDHWTRTDPSTATAASPSAEPTM